MAKRVLETAVILGAKDEMSSVVASAVSKAKGSLADLSGGSALVKGLLGGGLAYGAKAMLDDSMEAYKQQEYTLANLRVLAMERGKVNEELYAREEKFVTELSRMYSKSKEDYAKMFAIGLTNRISPEDMMGGIGESAAKLAKVFDNMAPDKAMLFFSRLKNDLRVSTSEMEKMANVIFKEKNLGVGINAEDTVQQLTEAYAKAGLGATNLGLEGAKAAEDLGILMGVFIAKGISGQTVGNNFRRIFDGIRDPEKMNKVLGRGKEYGIKLNFFDENGQFTVKNFEQQLGKLSKVSTQARAYILNPFSGKQGLSTDFLEYLAKYGEDIKVFEDQYSKVADLNDAVKELQGTLLIQESITETNKVNLKATFGKAMADDIKYFNKLVNEAVLSLDDLVTQYPELAKVTGEFVLMGSAAAGLYGGLTMAGSYIPALNGMLTSLAANGFWGVLGSAAASLMLFKEWYSWSSKQAQTQIQNNPTGEREKIMAGYNEIIEDPKTGFIKRQLARGIRAGIATNISLFGDDLPEQEQKAKMASRTAPASPFNPRSVSASFGINGVPTSTAITYSPQITITGTGANITKEDFQTVLRGNLDEMMGMINREQRRQGNLTYSR